MQIQGAVQGVGFRPYVYRLARELRLDGTVSNDARGVILEVEGDLDDLERFRLRLPREKPVPAVIDEVITSWLEPSGRSGFHIVESAAGGPKTAQLLPDIATCDECLADALEPGGRRHDYPFTNCTHCGPRFTIIQSLPYDRPRTTMEQFVMCDRCLAEYQEPEDRRFHAQPNACPECGPTLSLWDARGTETSRGTEALAAAAAALRTGEIVAVKGLGGFHLMVDARDGAAIQRLRTRKSRRDKPLALMARDLAQAGELCLLDDETKAILASPEAPIVLAPRRPTAPVHESVAPGNPFLGVMLPSTPLHHLLLRGLDFPLVATSGNLSEEPICIDENDAARRLGGIADCFLVHDRPIARHADDSIVRTFAGTARILRRARGFAPRPVALAQELPTILAVGPHLKSTVALSVGRQVLLSQHIGDMEAAEALAAFERVAADFLRLYEATPVAIAHDLHPDYASTRWATEMAAGTDPGDGRESLRSLRGARLIPVQHHHAHLAACLADNGSIGPALGVTWDGTGHGTDGTVWGGEFLLGNAGSFRRAAHLRPFRLPGGDAAIREPWRCALALLWEVRGEAALENEDLAPVRSSGEEERRILQRMLEGGINAPVTTSAGRLFDGMAALLGLYPRTSFEGQAAMALEFLADLSEHNAYPLPLVPAAGQDAAPEELVLDWGEMLAAALEDLRRGRAPAMIAARFHNGLAEGIVATAQAVGEETVALSGGCFQNRLLLERTVSRLRSAGFTVLLHRQVPPNDGGISLGQVAVAAAMLRQEKAG